MSAALRKGAIRAARETSGVEYTNAAAEAGRCASRGCACPAEHGKKQCAAHLAKLRAYGKERAAEGICRRCPGATKPGRSVCDGCARRGSAWSAQKRSERKALGLCTACGREPRGASLVCYGCWFRQSAAVNLHDRARGPEIRSIFDAQGERCALTGTVLVPGVNASLDHKVPRARGGGNETANLRWPTDVVHRAKQDLLDDEFLAQCRSVVEHLMGAKS